MELHINKRLKALLPPQTKQELEQLKANIDEEGILDPILYWNDGKKDIVIDGMTRYGIAQAGNLAFDTKEIVIEGGIEAVEEWIWKHQTGRRNMAREKIGEWYNSIKTSRGGDHTSKGTNGTLSDAAEKIAEIAGVSPRTVKRAGARDEAKSKLTKAAVKQVDKTKATDAEIKALAKLSKDDQDAAAHAMIYQGAESVTEAIQMVTSPPVDPFQEANEELTEPETPEKPAKPIKAKTGRDAELFRAKQCLNQWKETIRHMMSDSVSIDGFRGTFPGPLGDTTIEAAKRLYEALDKWQRGIQ